MIYVIIKHSVITKTKVSKDILQEETNPEAQQ